MLLLTQELRARLIANGQTRGDHVPVVKFFNFRINSPTFIPIVSDMVRTVIGRAISILPPVTILGGLTCCLPRCFLIREPKLVSIVSTRPPGPMMIEARLVFGCRSRPFSWRLAWRWSRPGTAAPPGPVLFLRSSSSGPLDPSVPSPIGCGKPGRTAGRPGAPGTAGPLFWTFGAGAIVW